MVLIALIIKLLMPISVKNPYFSYYVFFFFSSRSWIDLSVIIFMTELFFPVLNVMTIYSNLSVIILIFMTELFFPIL